MLNKSIRSVRVPKPKRASTAALKAAAVAGVILLGSSSVPSTPPVVPSRSVVPLAGVAAGATTVTRMKFERSLMAVSTNRPSALLIDRFSNNSTTDSLVG